MNAPTRDRGSLTIVTTLLMVVVLAGAALVVDGGRAMAARRHAANTAEAAARAAVSARSLRAGFDADDAAATARSFAARSGIDAADVEITFRTGPTGEPEIVVTITERRTAVFLALGGADELTVRATGAATFVYAV
jgi:Flp pilus assembly protein TadG